MERYSKYKDSGVKWLGEIPSHWEFPRLNQIGTYINGYAFKPKDWSNSGKPIIRIQDLTGTNDNPNFFNGILDNKYLVQKGDILVSWAATLDAFVWNKEDGWLNQHIFKAIPYENVDKHYFLWLLKIAMENLNNDNKHGIMMQHLTAVVFNHFRIPLPPIQEQRIIAHFLETTTIQIDTAISQQQKMIDLLNERKQIIINNAVTKGLDPNVKMKDSGIDWIGDIPEHWEVRRLKHIFSRIADGTHFSPEIVDDGYPYITAADVNGLGINYKLTKKISPFDYEKLVKNGCKANKRDVLLVKDGATTGRVGLKIDNEDCVTLSSVAMLTPPHGSSEKFMMYLMMSSMIQEQISFSMAGAAMPRITLIKLNNFRSCIPPSNEQYLIAEKIEKDLDPIIRLQNIIDKQISLLQERKQIIINEVVTGKVKVY